MKILHKTERWSKIERGLGKKYFRYFKGGPGIKGIGGILRRSMTLDETVDKFCTLNTKFVIKI